jgi:hypothetical protein
MAKHGEARRDRARQPVALRWDGHIHIDGRQGTVGDGAADGAGKGESGVEGGAGGRRGRSIDLGSHCDGCGSIKEIKG